MVAVIDYGLGNSGSIVNMLRVIGEKSEITSDTEKIGKADHIILPGVGAFDAGMSELEKRDLISVLQEEADKGKPILGICLGMQLLGRRSEEGKRTGLSLIPFESVRFRLEDREEPLKIPHMGWNMTMIKQNRPLVDGIGEISRYYFVHSYHAVCDSEEYVLMTCEYGYEFAAAVCKDNLYGVQFHPEKSHDFGMKILENFVRKC